MGRYKNNFVNIEDLQSLSISDIKQFIKPYTNYNGTITYSRNGKKTGSIGVQTDVNEDNGILLLSYSIDNGTSVRYEINLISKPSNLGKGIVWYFVCPKTNVTCRILHFNNGYFYHRSAFPGIYYENQLLSKNWRSIQKALFMELNEKVYDDYYRKHRKRIYKGKPTLEEIRLQKLIEERESYQPDPSILKILS